MELKRQPRCTKGGDGDREQWRVLQPFGWPLWLRRAFGSAGFEFEPEFTCRDRTLFRRS